MHICFFFPSEKLAFVGDTMFALGCGRLFEGTPAEMWHSLNRLAELPDETKVYRAEYTAANAAFALSVDPDNTDLQAGAVMVEVERARGELRCPPRSAPRRRPTFLRAGDPALRLHLDMIREDDEDVFAEIRRRKDNFRMENSAGEIIKALDMQPHPEGGWYAETFRDVAGPDGRARSTAIYYLLEAGDRSHWHRVDALEVWHWHAGAPLRLSISDDGRSTRDIALGPDVLSGQRPQGIVPTAPGRRQRARAMDPGRLHSGTRFRIFRLEMAAPDWAPEDRRG